MAILFNKGRSTITEHIGNIFKEGELEKEMVSRKFRLTVKKYKNQIKNERSKVERDFIKQ